MVWSHDQVASHSCEEVLEIKSQYTQVPQGNWDSLNKICHLAIKSFNNLTITHNFNLPKQKKKKVYIVPNWPGSITLQPIAISLSLSLSLSLSIYIYIVLLII